MKTDHVRDLSLSLGKLPPQSVDIEETLLGCFMLSFDAILNTIDLISPRHFYKDHNQVICQTIHGMYKQNIQVDLLTLVEELNKTNDLERVGGIIHLSKLTNKVSSTTDAEHYARIVSEKFIKREYIRVSHELQSKAFDESEDMQDIITFAEKSIFAVSEYLTTSEPKLIEETLHDTYNMIELAKERKEKGEFTGVPTGLKQLDNITGGWQNSDLIILGARPAMGKTSIAMHHCKSAAFDDFPTIFFSCEMGLHQLNQRLISGETDYTPSELRTGSISNLDKIADAVGILMSNKIIVDDTANINIHELCAKSRRAKKKHGIKLIIIDYIQLITVGKEFGGNREQEVSFVARTLKGLAKDLDVPVIALAQLNRGLEARPDKKPKLSDLRESGAIEQDADIVMFAHRPSVYGEDTIMVHNGREEVEIMSEGVGMLVIAKNRHGMLDDVMFKHNIGLTRLDDFSFDNEYSEPYNQEENGIF